MIELDPDQLRDLYARHRQGLFTLALSITRRRERAEDAVHEAFARLCRHSQPARTSVATRASANGADGEEDESAEVMGDLNGEAEADGQAAGGEPPTAVADPVAYVFRAVRHSAVDHVRRYWPGGNRTATAADLCPAGRRREAGDPSAAAGDALFDRPADDDRCRPEARSIEAETADWVARSVEQLPDEQREAVVLRVYGGLTFEQIATVVRAPLSTVAARYRRALDRLRPHLENLR